MAPMPQDDTRDILIEVRAGVRALVESKNDHEARIRASESHIVEMKATWAEQGRSSKRLIAIGMLLAALFGGIGDVIKHALGFKGQ